MNQEQHQPLVLDHRTQQAAADLEATIRQRYPGTSFELTRSPDDPRSLHLMTFVDLDDPDEVGDLVLEQVLDLNVTQGIPLHVIPVRTAERIAAEKQRRAPTRRRGRPLLSSLGLFRH